MRGIAGQVYVAISARIAAGKGDIRSIGRSDQDLINLNWVWAMDATQGSINRILRCDLLRVLVYRQKEVCCPCIFLILRNAARMKPCVTQYEDMPESPMLMESLKVTGLEMDQKDV